MDNEIYEHELTLETLDVDVSNLDKLLVSLVKDIKELVDEVNTLKDQVTDLQEWKYKFHVEHTSTDRRLTTVETSVDELVETLDESH